MPKKGIEIKISGFKFISSLKNLCQKVIEDATVADADYVSACILYLVISDALERYVDDKNESEK